MIVRTNVDDDDVLLLAYTALSSLPADSTSTLSMDALQSLPGARQRARGLMRACQCGHWPVNPDG